MIKGSTIRMRRRALFVSVVTVVLLFSVLIVRLVYLQIISGPYLFKMANSQQLASTKLNAKRGLILDRNLIPLAQSATVWNVVLEPNYIKKDETRNLICQGLSEILDIPKDELLDLSKKRSFYTIIKKKVDNDVKNKIVKFKSDNNISDGIRLIEDYKRFYPMGTLASNVLGFTGNDGQGLAGVESYYDKTLKGEQGKLVSAKNAIGTDMPYDYEHMIPSSDGKNLVLTIDSNIQKIIEEKLKRAIADNDVRNRGAAIAMDPNTGEILALAVEEGFDPNNPFELVRQQDIDELNSTPESEKSKKKLELLSKQWRNKVISDNYYAGSVFKMIVASMGLELGVVSEDSQFHCSGGIKISERSQYIRCHRRSGHGPINFVEALCKSCNPAFITLGQSIGPKNFFDFYESFGFHEKSGIDLPGETSDVFFSQNGDMQPIDLAVASIGQNFGITSMQMVTAACAIANGGKLVTPHIVKEIRDNDGNIIQSFPTNIRRSVISEQTAKRVSKMMEQNALPSGGAKNAYIPGFRVAGKTGTAEKKEHLLVPGQKDYISSFCGFAPADDPKIVFLTYLDTPKGAQYYGGLIAAPLFASTMSEILPYMGVQPQYNEEEAKKYGIKTPDLTGKKVSDSKNEIINLTLKPIVIGNGEMVSSQIPSPGSLIASNGSVILYTEESSEDEVKVPDFIGLTIDKAKDLANSVGLNLSVSGSHEGLIVSQSPKKSEVVKKGSIINIVIKTENVED